MSILLWSGFDIWGNNRDSLLFYKASEFWHLTIHGDRIFSAQHYFWAALIFAGSRIGAREEQKTVQRKQKEDAINQEVEATKSKWENRLSFLSLKTHACEVNRIRSISE